MEEGTDGWGRSLQQCRRTVRVLVADDHPVVRTGLAAVIAQESGLELVAQAENGQRAVALSGSIDPTSC